LITLAKESLSLIDNITSNFADKKELLNEINRVYDMRLDLEKTRVEITYNQNKCNRTAKVLYFKDKDAMSIEKVSEMFLHHSKNMKFIEQFVERYENNCYLSKLSKTIISTIEENKDYSSLLQQIVNIIFDSYKSTRDVYFFIKHYEEKMTKNTEKKSAINVKYNIFGALQKLQALYQPQIELSDFAPEIFKRSDFSIDQVKVKKIN
jgi:phosphoenolpyruvate carboxylase